MAFVGGVRFEFGLLFTVICRARGIDGNWGMGRIGERRLIGSGCLMIAVQSVPKFAGDRVSGVYRLINF